MKKFNNWTNTIPGNLAACFFLIVTLALPDIWLRFQTRWIGAYSIFELAPNLFTLLWSVILTALVTMVPSRKIGRVVYGIVYYLAALYAVVQYGAYLLLGKFLYISDFLFAGEGADYASWVVDLLSAGFLVQVVILIAAGVVGILLFPDRSCAYPRGVALHGAIILACIVAMVPIPKLYGEKPQENSWDDFTNLAIEYDRFANANTDMELTGVYQYLFRDIQIQIERNTKDYSEEITMLDGYFEQKPAHSDNTMTGLLKGKNVIVVMLETVDDWVITPEDTPTLYRMMKNGISFTDFYTPGYSSGYTFNTEFAFNTSVYPYTNGNSAHSLGRNSFSCSIARRFSDAGYTVNSYHEGQPDFYNREVMHKAWGYKQYYCYQDYEYTGMDYLDDRYLTECDGLYTDVTSDAPFFSFVITYSVHLPFTDEDPLAQTALALYPQYDVQEDREVAILRAKARLTDDMFAGLLERLEADGMLEDTVIVGFGDHYAYGLSDQQRLQQLSEEAGCPILERTPAFVYCAGCDLSMEVDKVMQITDLAPTIMNLFGLEVPHEIMGSDIFDENYEGHVVFANGTWLNDTTYVKNGAVVWNNGMTEAEIAQMNADIQQIYQVNDALLDSDYYTQ